MSVGSNNTAKTSEFMEVHDIPSANVLVQCRTVVEKDGFVSTGILTAVEGDMLEVEIGDFKQFELKENVKLTVYSPAGIYIINSIIIAKDDGSLMVINPPHNQRKFQERRGHHRVDTARNGVILSIPSLGGAESREELAKPVPVVVNNISVSGIGFTVKETLVIPKSGRVEMEIDFGSQTPCAVEIVRSQEGGEEGEVYYGGKFIDLPEDKLNSLRAFILKAQVEFHATNKNEDKEKRSFK